MPEGKQTNAASIAIVTVETLPVIKQQIKIVGAEIRAEIAALDLDNMIPCAESKKLIVNTRISVNKRIDLYEEQRKAVHKEINSEYNEMLPDYKVEILEQLLDAKTKLKAKEEVINSVILKEKKDGLIIYFNEMIEQNSLDFLTFDKYIEVQKIKFNLTDTLAKMQKALNEFLIGINSDIALINKEEFEVDILVEYKSTLKCSESVLKVKKQKEDAMVEAARVKRIEHSRRASEIIKRGFKVDDEIDTYSHYHFKITWAHVAHISKPAFAEKLSLIDEDIKKHEAVIALETAQAAEKLKAGVNDEPKEEKATIPSATQKPIDWNTGASSVPKPKSIPSPPPPTEAPPEKEETTLAPPTIEKEKEIEVVEFRITDTLENILGVVAYMEEHNVKFESID